MATQSAPASQNAPGVHKKTYHCSWCGAERALEELNGVDILTGDDSHANCAQLVRCDSPEAQRIFNDLISCGLDILEARP
ncbi:hypothetical protein [Marinobacterium litorale]|uniref:hypothetical protein n=1 Tax=Marinobacterium litorale TaxID=404770 RepID=UPI00042613E5|nr:hypothetical protein [Marinobacterium litorale]